MLLFWKGVSIIFQRGTKRLHSVQECIPVGCVPPASVAVSSAPMPYFCHAYPPPPPSYTPSFAPHHAHPLPHMCPPCHAHPPITMHAPFAMPTPLHHACPIHHAYPHLHHACPPPVNRITDRCKTLPSRNFVCGR